MWLILYRHGRQWSLRFDLDRLVRGVRVRGVRVWRKGGGREGVGSNWRVVVCTMESWCFGRD